ncbi:MAG: hypothetical protein ACLFSQ_08700 [Candidatus Zixiibacteriota bacterium]
MIFEFGCASRASVGYNNPNKKQPLNQVVFLDNELSARIAVDDIGSNRTATNTLEVWTQLRNLSRHKDYRLSVRTHFYDASGRELEVTEWQFLYLTELGVETYRTQSIQKDIDSYYIEVKEVEQREYTQKKRKIKPKQKEKPSKDDTNFASSAPNPSSIGMGVGISYSGVGAKFQYNTSLGNVGIAYHLGAGYDISTQGYSANQGLKTYIYKNLYFDAIIWLTVIDGKNHGGPGVVAGYDFQLGQSFGFNLGVGFYSEFKDDEGSDMVFDIGFFFNF